METTGNPYAAPAAPVMEAQESAEDLWIASRTQRFFTFVIDLFCYMFFSFIIGIFIALAGGGRALATMGFFSRQLFGIVVMMAFYMFFEALFSRTPGKWICGTRVVDMQGEKPPFLRLLGRNLARFIPFEPFSFFSEGAIGWHDTASGTRVVRTRGTGRFTLAESERL